jgi:hypothetical protein
MVMSRKHSDGDWREAIRPNLSYWFHDERRIAAAGAKGNTPHGEGWRRITEEDYDRIVSAPEVVQSVVPPEGVSNNENNAAGKTLGSIFTDSEGERHRLGILRSGHGKAVLVGLDLVSLVRLCRLTEQEWLKAACIPYENIAAPPFLQHDIVLDLKKKRIQIGYVYTDSGDRGTIYQVRFKVAEVMRRWDMLFLHLHEPTEDEVRARMAETNRAATFPVK